MPQLVFRYATVSSGKTLNLLTAIYNYEQQQKKILLIKPNIDTRFGETLVKSRAGMSREADHVISDIKQLRELDYKDIYCLFVDEVQFFTEDMIDELLEISEHIPVLCYGLRTDFKTHLFPGTKRLFESADKLEEIKNICCFAKCNKKSTRNLRMVDGVAVFEGDQIQLGDETYKGVCKTHYRQLKLEMKSKD